MVITGTNTALLTLQQEPSLHFSSVLTILCWSYPNATDFSNVFKCKINIKHGFMEQDISPASCETDRFFAAQGDGEFNVKGSCFRISYNSFHTPQKSSSALIPLQLQRSVLMLLNLYWQQSQVEGTSGQSTAAGSDLMSKHALTVKQQLVSQDTAQSSCFSHSYHSL